MPRILFFADTHLGFDMPLRPKIERRRRGVDFFNAFYTILSAARKHHVDAIIHGGDLFFRSKIPMGLIDKVFNPLLDVADQDIPVYLVPGNHERSVIPTTLFTRHRNIHIFDRPRTFTLSLDGLSIGLSGFPNIRKNSNQLFSDTVVKTDWNSNSSDVKLLCLHQTFNGSTIGPRNYKFKTGSEVIPKRLIPNAFSAVLTGHIHRYQILNGSFSPQTTSCPIIYPGSTERTSFAEKDDPKGYVLIDLITPTERKANPVTWKFVALKSRPMIEMEIQVKGLNKKQILQQTKQILSTIPTDGVLKIILNYNNQAPLADLDLKSFRDIAPETMNLSVVPKSNHQSGLQVIPNRNPIA